MIRALVSEDVELDASNFKQKDQIAEMTVKVAKSGVGGYGLCSFQRVRKRAKTMLRTSPGIGSGLVSHRLMKR